MTSTQSIQGLCSTGSGFSDSFWAKTERGEFGCLLWQGSRNPAGYGSVYVPELRRSVGAHRVAYELAKGPIPDGLHVDHLCRVPQCVNPDHLEAVTERENILRGIGPTAANARKTHCRKGHPYDEENTYTTPQGRRICRECQRGHSLRWWRKQAIAALRRDE